MRQTILRISSWLVISFLMLPSTALSVRCEAKSSAFSTGPTAESYGSSYSTSTFAGGGHQGFRGARSGAFDLQNSGFGKFKHAFVNRRFKEHAFEIGGLNSEFGKNVVSSKVSKVSGDAEASNRKAIHKEADAAAKTRTIKPFDLSSETMFKKNQVKTDRANSSQLSGIKPFEPLELKEGSFTEHGKPSLKFSKLRGDKDKQVSGMAGGGKAGTGRRGFGEFRSKSLFERSFQKNAERRATASAFGESESEESFGRKNREKDSAF